MRQISLALALLAAPLSVNTVQPFELASPVPVQIKSLGELRITSYRSIRAQTDSSPNWTSIGHHVHPFGCAVSQDLIKSGEVRYGDVLVVPGFGKRVVNDVMHGRFTRSIDLWVGSYKEEKAVGVRTGEVFVIH